MDENEEGGDNAIFTSRVDGRGQRLLLDGYRFTAGFGPYLGSPAYSPDGSEIAFALSGLAPVTTGAFVMARNGTGIRPLLACSLNGPAPACEVDSLDWSPNGRRLALGVLYAPFVTEQVVVVNADGSGATVVRPGSKPLWSPDGRKLGSILPAPMTAPNGSGSLQISNADGSGLRTVRQHVSFAAWQPLPRRRPA